KKKDSQAGVRPRVQTDSAQKDKVQRDRGQTDKTTKKKKKTQKKKKRADRAHLVIVAMKVKKMNQIQMM
ncbi:MAG TPA: hypothetical protein QF487_06735, partial [Acidimicrobiales bacterium]|nr:hypothetical protein [Acidimicrobiales bacterium]